MSYPRTVGPSTVTTSTVLPIPGTYWRGGFYAHGKHFIVYGDGTGISYRHSSDEGASWSAPVTVRASVPAADPVHMAVHFDGIYLHYALGWNGFNQPLRYRRGLINSDGSIAWSAVEQVADAAHATYLHRYISICTDSEGCPVISYLHWAFTPTLIYPYVTKSSTNDGTWSTETGYPYQLTAVSNDNWRTEVISLGSERLCVIYSYYNPIAGYELYNKIFDGSSWSAEEGPITVGDYKKHSITSGPNSSVLLSYDRNKDTQFRRRPWGGPWGGEIKVLDQSSGSSNVISRGPDGNTIYIFQFTNWGSYIDYVIYAVSTDGGTTWGDKTGGAPPEVWIDETVDDAPIGWGFSSSYQTWDGVISFVYITKNASPYNVRYAALRFYESEDLKATFEVGQGSANLLARFGVGQDSVDLLGNAAIRHMGTPVELLGKVDITHSVDLLGRAEIRQSDSAELFGNAEVQHSDFAELLGNFEVQQLGSAELLGKFEAQATAELSGGAIIRHVGIPVELLGKAEVQQSDSAELLGKADIRQPGSAEFIGEFVVRHESSADLLGEFISKNVGSADLLGEFVTRQSESAELSGGAIIRHVGIPVELLGKAEVQQSDSAELLGKADIRQPGSAEFIGEFVVRHESSADLLGEFIVRARARTNLSAKFQVTHSECLLSKLWIRHPSRLWTNRRYVNGVVELDEAELSDVLLEYVIQGVMDDIKSQLISEAMLVYDSWTDITETPKLIRRATTYGTVASLYSRDINDPNRRIVLGLRPIRIRAAEVRSAQERAMDYWESRMEKMMSLYLTSGGRRLMIVDTEDEEAVFSLEDIPFYTEDPYKIKVR